ncbi:MAG: alkaline phosphatase family protein [Clostridia bacterium]|nr:alkaline phosphatase family protein [Clostridia bacterium]
MKVLLVLIDGARPDAIEMLPEFEELRARSEYSGNCRTVMPSVTLPCHVSLFHSVTPERHGTTTNVYSPQVRPITGLCELLAKGGKRCGFFYDWEELRDLTRPGSLFYSYAFNGHEIGYRECDDRLTDIAIEHIAHGDVDFTFLYLGYPDDAGHRMGWMSEEYMYSIKNSLRDTLRVLDALPDEYAFIITADHGGHARAHGSDCPEDMTIPLFIGGTAVNEKMEKATILDIAPTVAELFGIAPDREWEGVSLCKRS